MLHKRFKSAKCKTSLKLATSRIKLMKNKKGVQINQMKKELAHLLETGQDRTARIRVEHVIREEKMIAAYDLIEIYCELIVARLPIIESQKTCPIDLKEAVASVIFAAPRCSDISELADVRKQFTAKYGKDFVSAAIELHPDCGVSRMLVEKLSAVAPDLQTKIKVLSAVAKDHNIDWDPTSFEEKESKPPNDLLNGPGNLENASMANVDPPKVQPAHNHEEKQNEPFNFADQNRKYTLRSQNVTSGDTSGETSSSGVTHERMEKRQNWNMEFKDATSAAQAAAESAERAAMAARYAAQFSSQEKIANHYPSKPHTTDNRDRPHHVSDSSAPALFSSQEKIANHHPTGFHTSEIRDKPSHVSAPSAAAQSSSHEKIANHRPAGSHTSDSRDNPPHVSGPSGFSDESPLDDRTPKILNQHIEQIQHDTSQKASERFDGSNNDSVKDEKWVNDFRMTDGSLEESLHEDQEGSSSPEREFKPESYSGQKEMTENEHINLFATEKQSTIRSSHSHSSTSSDEVDVGKKSVVGNPFAVVDHKSPFEEAKETSPVVKDEAVSDDDDNDDDDDNGGPKFDTGFEYDEMETTHFLVNAYIENYKMNAGNQPISQSRIFSESRSFGDHSVKSVEPSETDNHGPATFDHSDGPDSGSESELLSMNPEPRRTRIELTDLVEGEPSFEDEEKRMQSQHELKKHDLDQKSSFEDQEKQMQSQRELKKHDLDQETSFEDQEKRMQSQRELKKHNLDQESSVTFEDNNDSLNQRLEFATLTGGLRNKGGLRYPPYTKNAAIEKSTEESSVTGSGTPLQSSLDSRVSRIDRKTKASIPISDSDSDSEEKPSRQAITRSRFPPPAAFFDDDGTDSEDEVPKQAPVKIRLGSGLSRRTRGSPSAPYSKTRVEPKPEPEPMPETVIPAEPQAYARRFKVEDDKQISESQRPFGKIKSTTSEPQVNDSAHTKQEAVKIISESKNRMNEGISSRIMVDSSNSKIAGTQNLGSEKSRENLVKKPSHVHPKLPEYDSLAARLQSLRTDRP